MIHAMHVKMRVWRISRDAIRWYAGASALLLILFFLCPWGWKSLSDEYFPYSGVVVEKGSDFAGYGRYIIIEDAQGKRSKKYVDPYSYAYVRIGTPAIKERGFGKRALPVGEKSPFQTLQEIKQRQKLRHSQDH
ncbi:MAG TPA: hypothetical protein VFR24_04660 [Candidatus Angelobacter sp.]|nr:hypothetical protein [Candidatus Angelobacter sp.]